MLIDGYGVALLRGEKELEMREKWSIVTEEEKKASSHSEWLTKMKDAALANLETDPAFIKENAIEF